VSATVLTAALAGVCAALGIVGIAEEHARRAPTRRRRRGGGVRRALSRLAVALLGRRASPPRDLQARLDAAGSEAQPGDVMAVKLGTAITGALLAVPAAQAAPGRLGVVVLVALPLAGSLAPDLVLRRRSRRRAAALELELADVVELLRVAIDAGLPPVRALAEVGARHDGALGRELARTADAIALGVAQTQALERLRARAPIPGVTALAAALGRAALHGAPPGPALAAIAHDARAERARRLRDRAARAAPQIQLVVALLLVPAVLMLVAAGLAAALL
jgi:tight adherence protein C